MTQWEYLLLRSHPGYEERLLEREAPVTPEGLRIEELGLAGWELAAVIESRDEDLQASMENAAMEEHDGRLLADLVEKGAPPCHVWIFKRALTG